MESRASSPGHPNAEVRDSSNTELFARQKPTGEDARLSIILIHCVQPALAIRQHRRMTTILLLTLSNIFMTFAWYGHLKYRHAPLFKVIVISWLIAFAEYCFQVPANRIGSYEFTTAQLKTIQEVITLTVFSVFSVLYLNQPLKWNYFVGFAMMIGAVAVIFKKW